MRSAILHLGNIANNAYNNAKYLNKNRALYSHKALNFDNPHIMASPEWEEIDTLDQISEFAPSWPQSYEGHPEWYEYIETCNLSMKGECSGFKFNEVILKSRRRLAYWLKDQGLEKSKGRISLPIDFLGKLKVFIALPVYLSLHAYADLKKRWEWSKLGSEKSDYHLLAKKLSKQLEGYDYIQAYGADIIIPYILGIPYIAYEHGTLRELPFLETRNAKLLQEAYKSALHVVITNPDVLDSAKKLDLKNYTYIPHAVDTNRFSLKKETDLREYFGLSSDDKVIIAPARQNWKIKGNDQLIKAFAKISKTNPNVKLLLCDWGQNRDRTKALVKSLNIEAITTFYAPVPKLTSARMMQMADIVVDQLKLGVFGGITPEALSCGKPTIVFYEKHTHDWCFDSHPPILSAKNSEETYLQLKELLKSEEYREDLGQKGRAWVEKEYSIKQLVERHEALYQSLKMKLK